MAERGFLSSAKLIAACTLTSRLLGMVRDILCASFFGASYVWDAFVIAFIIPNLFRRLFGEGALTAAFVPVFVERLKNHGREAANNLLRALLSVLCLILLVIVLVGVGLTYLLPALSDARKLGDICSMLRVMLPYVLLICTTAILGSALNSLGHFFTPAFAPVVLNTVWIGALLIFGPDIDAVVAAVLIAGAAQLLIQIPPLLRRGFHVIPRFDRSERGLREIAMLFLPVVFGLALVQMNEVVDNVIAECFVPGDGAVSALYYANRLMQLPLALIGMALATAAFPLLSRQAAAEDTAGFSDSLGKALRACLFVAVPATAGLCVLAEPIVQVLFQYGEFSGEAVQRTRWVLILFSVGICAYSCNQILVRAFYARKETKVPVKVSASMVFANLALNLVLVWPLREAGLALSTALTGTATSFILYILLCRRVPEMRTRVGALLAKSLPLAVVMGAAVFGLHAWLMEVLPADTIGHPKIAQVARLAIAITVGIGLYFGGASLLRMKWRSALSRN